MRRKQCLVLKEAAENLGLEPEAIIRFIVLEWVVPTARYTDWQQQILDEEDLARARLIRELQETFAVNDEAIPIILNLIDQLNRTHLEIKERLSEDEFQRLLGRKAERFG